jgi:hypothetical protein
MASPGRPGPQDGDRRAGDDRALWSGGTRLSGLAGALPPLVLPAGPPRRPPLSPLTLSPSPRVSSASSGQWGPGLSASPRGLSFGGRAAAAAGSGARAGAGLAPSTGGSSVAGSIAGSVAGSIGGGGGAGQAVCVVLQIRPMSDPEWAEGCEQLLRVAPDGMEVRMG